MGGARGVWIRVIGTSLGSSQRRPRSLSPFLHRPPRRQRRLPALPPAVPASSSPCVLFRVLSGPIIADLRSLIRCCPQILRLTQRGKHRAHAPAAAISCSRLPPPRPRCVVPQPALCPLKRSSLCPPCCTCLFDFPVRPKSRSFLASVPDLQALALTGDLARPQHRPNSPHRTVQYIQHIQPAVLAAPSQYSPRQPPHRPPGTAPF